MNGDFPDTGLFNLRNLPKFSGAVFSKDALHQIINMR